MRPIYEWGTRVMNTPKALTHGVFIEPHEGIVAHQEGLRLWVLVEGRRTVETFHASYWEVTDVPVPDWRAKIAKGEGAGSKTRDLQPPPLSRSEVYPDWQADEAMSPELVAELTALAHGEPAALRRLLMETRAESDRWQAIARDLAEALRRVHEVAGFGPKIEGAVVDALAAYDAQVGEEHGT